MNLETSLAKALATGGADAVDLAHCQPFRLGPVEVVPASRLLRVAGQTSVTIQPLAVRVLIALAAAEGETCSRDDLVEACWNQRIVGDDAVHRIISTLRRDLAQVSGGAVAIETIPKVGYRLRVEGETGAGADVPEQVTQDSGHGVRRQFVAALLFAGLVSAGVFAATRTADAVTAIAVVPDDGAPGRSSARFADGLTGDLARLASTMPSLAFVEPGGTRPQEPLLLRVALDSGADKPSARVRLVDNKGGAVVWSRDFIAESGSEAELREIVANGISAVVQCGLDRSAEFDEPVGLRLFLGACEGLTTGDFERARMFAQQITRFRPGSPAGWACLANTTIFVAAKDGGVTDAVLANAETYARRALVADPKSGLAYVALAMAARWRGEPMLDILEQGIDADPDFAMLYRHYAAALMDSGMTSAAVDPALRAVALHPHDPAAYGLALATLSNAGRTQEALALSATMRRQWRYDRKVSMSQIEMLVHEPDAQTALAAFATNPASREIGAERVREALVWRTDPSTYDWSRFDRVARAVHADNPQSAWRLSATAARMGDRARAMEWLERAPTGSAFGWSSVFGRETAALRRDPRFFEKMARVGMVRRWEKSGRWPDFCAEPGLGYDCRASARAIALRTSSAGRAKART